MRQPPPSVLKPFLTLTLFASVFLILGLGITPLIDWDENIYAEAARQMVERGNYLSIYINDHPFGEKPPFFFWEASLSYHLFGINEFAVRLPSAIAGIVSVWLCFFFGRWMVSTRFGLLWGLVYLTSFLPALFARSAVLDHTFNMFIMLSAFSLYAYDVKYAQFLEPHLRKTREATKWKHWQLLTLASVSMGLGVLTKGPLGGVIPLVGFGTYKLFFRTPRISFLHFIYCAVVSLSVASSWYLANLWVHGFQFLEQFIEFQLALFSKPLEGHVGPFYYHFGVAIIGLFPWTLFLLLFKKQLFSKGHPHYHPLLAMCVGWLVFVLTLFSIVSTKLPHYSASIYIPLSLIVAMCLFRYDEENAILPRWVVIGFIGFGLLLAGVLAGIPTLLDRYIAQQNINFSLEWPWEIYVLAAGFLLGILLSGWYFWRNKISTAVVMVAITMFVGTQSLWRYQLPTAVQFSQQPLMDMLEEAYQNHGKVVFYRYVSFAALFYGKQPIEMLHTYKFPGNPDILNERQSVDLFVITERKNKKHLQKDHPLVEHLRDAGMLSLYRLAKTEQTSDSLPLKANSQ